MATITSAATGAINATQGGGAIMIIVLVLLIAFGAAAYFTGRLYGRTVLIALALVFVAVIGSLFALGGLSFG
jgi:hypothetical protein